jgi:hypothetical protein
MAMDRALVFKALEHRANRRAAQFDGQGSADVGNRKRPTLIEEVDNLTFAGWQFAEHDDSDSALHL